MDNAMNLKNYIKLAEKIMKKNDLVYSDNEKNALLDMIQQGYKAINGNNKPTHTGCRGFMETQDKDAQIKFATERYTMAPTYLYDCVWAKYGLKPAIEWFESIGLLNRTFDELLIEKDNIILRSNEFLEKNTIGNKVGQCKKSFKELENNLSELKEENSDSNKIAELITKCKNSLNEVEESKIILSDIDENDMIFINMSELSDLRDKCENDSFVKKHYEEVKNKADEQSLKDIKEKYDFTRCENDYSELNKKYKLWSRTASNVNFKVPENTTYGILSFILPSKENEKSGLGHVWIDDVSVKSVAGVLKELENGGFENLDESRNIPLLWKSLATKGSPVLRIEEKEFFSGNEKVSVYIENKDENDEGVWQYANNLSFVANEMYTLDFFAKVDGKFKKGLLAKIEFFDENNRPTGEFTHYFNRKAWIPCGDYNLRMQCDSICYAITGEIEYAQKAKIEILHFLDDFIQGAEYWMMYNKRPEGSDAYGGVQGGRNLCSVAISYSLIRNAKVFTKEEKELLFEMIDYMLRYMLDKRDRNILSLIEAQHGCSNWQLDMCIGSYMVMLAMPDYPDKKIWMMNSYRVIRALLVTTVNKDGSWPESIRYHHAALGRLAYFGRILRRELNEDWFAEDLLKGMFAYSVDMQTPAYEFFENKVSTPTFGDHTLSNGKDYTCHGLYFRTMEDIDKNLADKMYMTWCKAGKPVKKLWGEDIVLENLLYSEEYQVEDGFEMCLETDFSYTDSGIYIIREGYGTGKESYCAIMSSKEVIGHGHLDQGSFIIYKDSIPVIMDSGIEGYFDSSTQWYISSYSHSVMQFSAPPLENVDNSNDINLSAGNYSRIRGWSDLPRTSKVIDSSTVDNEYIVIEIENTIGKGIQKRTIFHYKEKDIYIIKDSVEEFKGDVLFTLPTVMKENKIDGNVVFGKGFYNVNLQVMFLSETKSIIEERGRSPRYFETEDLEPSISYIRATAEAENGFCVVISPNQNYQIKSGDLNDDILTIAFDDEKTVWINLKTFEVTK